MENFKKIYKNFKDSELIKNIEENSIDNYLVYSEDLPLIKDILSNTEVENNIKNNLNRISSKVNKETRINNLKKFKIDSIDNMDSLITLINGNLNDEISNEFINWIINSNELTLFYLEEAGKKTQSKNYYLVRDLLSKIKLSIEFEKFIELLTNAYKKALLFLNDEYLEDIRDEYLRLIRPRIDEIEEITQISLELYIKEIENELFNSPNLDIYQLITKFVDFVFLKLSIDKFPEYESCPEEEFEDYKSVVEIMYTQYSLKLIHNSIEAFSKI